MNMVKTDLIKANSGRRSEIRVPSKTIEIEFRCQHDESPDSEYCWLNGLTGRFNSAAFIYYFDKLSGKIFLKSRRGDFWASGGDPTPSKIYAVDCVGISYVLRERPEGLNVEHNGDARLEYAGIDVDCRGARKMTLDQVLQHILDVGGHYCEDEPDEGGI